MFTARGDWYSMAAIEESGRRKEKIQYCRGGPMCPTCFLPATFTVNEEGGHIGPPLHFQISILTWNVGRLVAFQIIQFRKLAPGVLDPRGGAYRLACDALG